MPNEAIPTAVIKNMLDTEWNTQSGLIPEPTFVDINDGSGGAQLRFDLNRGDFVFISSDMPSETEEPIGTWVYGNRTTRIVLEMHTKDSRQRLYNIKQEIRRIAHNQMHALDEFQRIQYVTFAEYIQDQMNLWSGRIILELVNNAILLET